MSMLLVVAKNIHRGSYEPRPGTPASVFVMNLSVILHSMYQSGTETKADVGLWLTTHVRPTSIAQDLPCALRFHVALRIQVCK